MAGRNDYECNGKEGCTRGACGTVRWDQSEIRYECYARSEPEEPSTTCPETIDKTLKKRQTEALMRIANCLEGRPV